MAISQDVPQPPIDDISLKIAYLEFHSNLPRVNELTSLIISLLWNGAGSTCTAVSSMAADGKIMQGAKASVAMIQANNGFVYEQWTRVLFMRKWQHLVS